jgi:3-hydroxybutyryl-CoA dehydrogenase
MVRGNLSYAYSNTKLEKILNRLIEKQKIDKKESQRILTNIKFSDSIKEIEKAEIVIEAIVEDLAMKKDVFQEIENLVSEKCIIATNTSSISIDKIAKATMKPENVIGMHFMNPVPIMKLVEIIKGEKTNNSIVKRTLDYVSLINKIPIECNDSPGFVSNRILMPMINEAAFTYMEGVATVEAIDEIMKLGMGHPMGPLKLADLIGIDVCIYIMDVLHDGFKNIKYKACPLLKDMVSNKKLGVKSGQGFYKY